MPYLNQEEINVLILDFGANHLHISEVLIEDGIYEILDNFSDTSVCGVDFDKALALHCL